MKIFTKINKRPVIISLFFIFLALAALAVVLLASNSGEISVLDATGSISRQERNLIYFGAALSLMIVIPVYILTFAIAWKYRQGNKKTNNYKPDWDRSKKLEILWWGVPLILILILSGVTWKSSHDLDPFKPLAAKSEQMKIQVISMNWKWLFIYPDEKIATVNYLALPVDKPVEFQITGDSAMNSFWIPQLGGQIYAMSGMSTTLHLKADKTGEYRGSSANISGAGFSGMNFMTNVTSQQDFDKWVANVKKSPSQLSSTEYQKMSQPSKNNPPTYYVLSDEDIYNEVLRKYLLP